MDDGGASVGIGVERKGQGRSKNMTAKRGPFIVDVEVNCRFGRSAKPASEARIARTGYVHFLTRERCLIVVRPISSIIGAVRSRVT